VLLFLAVPAFCQKFTFNHNKKRDAIHFKLIHNLVIIPVTINNDGPFNFILDSGVGPMIITDPLLVDSLQRNDLAIFKIRGRGVGPALEAYVINDLSVLVGKSSSKGLSVVLLKNDPFQLSAYLGIPVHGIIGSDFFKSFIVKLNYFNKKMQFYDPKVSIRRKGERIPIELIKDKPYMDVLVKTENEVTDSLLLLVDSGAGHAISLDLTGEEKEIQPQKTISANLGIGLTGPINGLVGRLPEIKLGNFSFKDVITSFPVYEDLDLHLLMTEKDGSIGGEILKRFTVLFNYPKNEIYLQRNRNFKNPFEHDMSGMEIYKLNEKEYRFFISRIDKNSPAEKAQFLVNDEILSINFKRVREYSLDDINQLLQKETNGNLIFEILRDDEVLFKLLQLKRRI